ERNRLRRTWIDMSASRPSQDANYSPSEGSAAAQPQAWGGVYTLLYKELLRFWKVSFQTIAAPILTSLLYLLIFSHVLESRVAVFGGRVGYTAFLVPGLVMMAVLQNAFANSSSSLIQSLPPFWQVVSHFTPFFYMIDGFRYGFFGLSDAPPFVCLAVVAGSAALLASLAIALLARGWKLRH